MKRMKCIHKWATAILGLGLAVTLAPLSRAQENSQAGSAASSNSSASSAADTQKRLDELQKEVTELQSQIAAMKAENTPSVRTAALTEPASQPAGNPLTPAPAAADAPPKISLSSLLGPVTVSGFGDAYYGYNSDHPFDNTSGLRYFDGSTNAFAFNMAELVLDKPPDASSAESRLGYHVSAGYGQAARIVNGSDNTGDGSNFYLKEAYMSYLAPVGKGLTITVGKFVTPIGAEVIESNANWNYSRSMLFYYAIPYFHFGASAKYAFNAKWAVTGFLVNGWNNSAIFHDLGTGQSSGLTYIGSIAYTPNAKWSVIQNYSAGPVTDAYTFGLTTVNDWKQLSDTVISYTPNAKWAFMLNGDYGFGPQNWTCTVGGCAKSGPQATWWGLASYGKYTFNPKSNFALRYEYYGDPQGYSGLLYQPATGSFLGGGFAQEVTGTYSYNVTSNLLVRAEYRYDFASQPMFEKGLASVKEQNTAVLGFVYSFSSADLK
jgi:Putative beta-barrel porin-2, OmpL-like. bbp2